MSSTQPLLTPFEARVYEELDANNGCINCGKCRKMPTEKFYTFVTERPGQKYHNKFLTLCEEFADRFMTQLVESY